MKNYPILLLGAGAATHSGSPRGLVDFNGRPWIMRQLRQIAAAHGHRVLVVLGAAARQYFEVLPWTETAQRVPAKIDGLSVTTLVIDHHELGIFTALQAGGKALAGEKQAGVFVLPMDVPAAKLEVWTHLKMRLTGDIASCFPVYEGRAGHPVLLSHRYLETLLEMPAETRLDVQLRVLPQDKIQAVPVDDPSVAMSIASAEHWHKFVQTETIA